MTLDLEHMINLDTRENYKIYKIVEKQYLKTYPSYVRQWFVNYCVDHAGLSFERSPTTLVTYTFKIIDEKKYTWFLLKNA